MRLYGQGSDISLRTIIRNSGVRKTQGNRCRKIVRKRRSRPCVLIRIAALLQRNNLRRSALHRPVIRREKSVGGYLHLVIKSRSDDRGDPADTWHRSRSAFSQTDRFRSAHPSSAHAVIPDTASEERWRRTRFVHSLHSLDEAVRIPGEERRKSQVSSSFQPRGRLRCSVWSLASERCELRRFR